MNLGNFLSGIVAKDPTTPPIVREPVQTEDRHTKLKDAVKNLMDSTRTEQKLLKGETSAIPANEQLVVVANDVKTSAEKELSNITSVDIPKVTKQIEEVIGKVDDGVPFLPENFNPDSELDADKIYVGRQLVNEFLSEFSDLLEAGKELDSLNQEKSGVVKEGEGLMQMSQQEKENRNKVAASITNLFTGSLGSDEKLEQDLKNAYDAFMNYANRATESSDKLFSKHQNAAQAISMKINAKKQKVEKLFAVIGGPKVMENIRKVIRVCETIGKKGLREYYGTSAVRGVSEGTINEVHKSVVSGYSRDAFGMQLLAQKGDILDVMRVLFDPKNIPNTIKNLPTKN